MAAAASNTGSKLGEELRVSLSKDKSHHGSSGRFVNPWGSSFRMPTFSDILKYFLFTNDMATAKKSVAEGKAPQVVPLDKAVIDNPPTSGELQLTWLGHASLMLQVSGATILFDPVFSSRCSPFQWIGPKRYTKAPCSVDELPAKVDFLVLSHNHYDHLDWSTLAKVAQRYPGIKVFAPLGNEPILKSLGFKDVKIGDWWQEFTTEDGFTFACTPAQHMTGRWLHDTARTLWSSWVVKSPSGSKFFFSGDTGYSTSVNNPNGDYCKAFENIGKVYGPIDLSAIAIGAYGPSRMFSGVHINPEQAVKIHNEIGSRRSIGIHWGTFILTEEPVDEPPMRLALEMDSSGNKGTQFGVLDIGQTIRQPAA
ncbi:Protein-lysine N-methyltransferase efm4 [Dipsacomyces acuminosporus]|nr:Protein-lysine N-methyltransferase efm4 [Dipsacomyces acuminosporus]